MSSTLAWIDGLASENSRTQNAKVVANPARVAFIRARPSDTGHWDDSCIESILEGF